MAADHTPSQTGGAAPTTFADLDAHLASLAEHLQAGAPTDEGGRAELAALLPCDLPVGQVALACWQLPGGDSAWELVRLADGYRLDDAKALREGFALLAMAETLEQQVEPHALAELRDVLCEWQEAAAASSDDPDTAQVAATVARAIEKVDHLQQAAAAGSAGGARVASPIELDRLGGSVRELERHWTMLEAQAERWATGAWQSDPQLVELLWRALAAARRGPLLSPVAAALQRGREAGLALADEVLAGDDA